MLLSFSVENWRAFKEKTDLSLYASKERFSSEHNFVLPPIYRKAKVLPLAAIYGINGSGKTSFIEALDFLRFMIVEGMPVNRRIPINSFKLDSDSINKPSKFVIEFYVDSTIYKYKVSLSQMRIISEELLSKNSRKWEPIFKRDLDSFALFGNFNTEQNQLIEMNTRPNQLYLHTAVALNSKEYLPIYNWFANNLQLLGVNAQYNRYSAIFLRNDFKAFINDKLKKYNTGIEGIDLQPVPLNSVPIPEDALRDIIATAPMNSENATAQIRVDDSTRGSDIYIFTVTKEGEIEVSKIVLLHASTTGELTRFELSDESRGTQRLLELLPLFFEMASLENETSESKVFVIDELDQSFHTTLTLNLIKDYLKSCTATSKHQLIFSLHDLMLMDQNVLRKDEMWFCNKRNQNEAELTCVGNITGVRSDTDILKNYVKGFLKEYSKF